MTDTGHVGAASNDMAEVTQRIATIVTYAQAARKLLDHPLPDLDEVRQALDCIVRDGFLASDVIYRIRGLRVRQGGASSANFVVLRRTQPPMRLTRVAATGGSIEPLSFCAPG